MCQDCVRSDNDRKAENDRNWDSLAEKVSRSDTTVYLKIFDAYIRIDPAFRGDLHSGIVQAFQSGKDCPDFDYAPHSKLSGGVLYINNVF